MSIKNIAFVHGFMGDSFLPRFNIDLQIYSPEAFNLDLWLESNPDGFIIAYSMGGRSVLSQLSPDSIKRVKKIALLSTGLGISCSQKVEQRKKLEDKMLAHLTRRRIGQFWNSLDIFKADAPVKINKKKIKHYRAVFNQMRLSKQAHYADLINRYKDKFEIYLGESDSKYRLMYKRAQIDDINLVAGGHRSVLNSVNQIISNWSAQ